MRVAAFVTVAATVVALSGCSRLHLGGEETPEAIAVVRSAAGDSLGVLSFDSEDGGVEIEGTLKGLTPGVHGIHLHTMGMCEGPAFTTAGGHFNPAAAHHGLENPEGPHAGDLPNITVNSSGEAKVDLDTKRTTIAALRDSDGASIVVHAAQDDQKSDPAGNSGARVACGVLRAP